MPHTCPVCQKSFKKANHLRDHCKSKSHRLPETLLPTSSTPPSIVPTAVRYLATQGVQSPIQSFGSQCTRCYLWVPNHIALIEHLNRKHLSKSNKIPLPRISTSNSACTVVEPERHIPLQASDLAAPEQKLPSSSAQGPTVTPQATIQNIPTGSRDPLGLLNAYIARNLPKPMDNPSAETRCRACNVIIENKAQHYIEAHPHLKCDDCDRLFDSSDEFEHHVRDTPKHSSCTLCGVSFRSLEPLESCRHIVRCQAAGTSGRLPARCLICSKTYHSVDELSSHVKAVHAYGQSGALYIVNGMASLLERALGTKSTQIAPQFHRAKSHRLLLDSKFLLRLEPERPPHRRLSTLPVCHQPQLPQRPGQRQTVCTESLVLPEKRALPAPRAPWPLLVCGSAAHLW
ncbi:hypothetical protein PHLGIDRAFT_325793 [Phlebiopsis gigantea 11061_1 CR5-6]|uniref:C2H2-type domain-containing protein n=1 Tax=Phlebiopsis gigantea (strain 11061_1 CR5-6) TaxID=745531 RepID=A0A0C3NBK0_PHLG1|nr:hypothetical protein PHLGIDRAFT_325793 [Phlebiopsis gigantea 11061_1 CR5-6]